MSITTEHQGGFIDLSGRRMGTVQILHIVRRQPQIVWQCRCIRCASSWVSSHTLLVNGAVSCPNRSCGRTAPVATSDASFTRAFIQEKRPQPAPVAPQRPTFNMDADPAGIRAMLDAEARQRERERNGK
jgi:hypothetical protein